MKSLMIATVLAASACGVASSDERPAAPTGLTVGVLGSGLHVTWTDNSKNETEFELERKTSGDFAKIASLVFDTVQYHDGSVEAGTRYTYRVRAVTATASSPYSAEVAQTAPMSGTGGGAGGGTGGASGGGTGGSTGGGTGGSTGGGTGGSTGGGAGGGSGIDAGVPPLADGGYSFQQHIVPIFNASCGAGNNNCHSRIAYGPTTSGGCRGWLALENLPLGSKNPTNMANTGCPDRTLWQRLTELDSWMCEPTRKKYITPRSLAASQVFQAVAGDPSGGGTCNKSPGVPLGRMPPTPALALDAASVKKLETWIMQGAPNN